MSHWSRPTVPRPLAVGVGIAYVAFLLYALLAVGNVLLGILPGVLIVACYVGWRFLVVLESIAGSLETLARAHDVD
jgi:hypothetical protein